MAYDPPGVTAQVELLVLEPPVYDQPTVLSAIELVVLEVGEYEIRFEQVAGVPGAAGKSAYQIWLDAGNTGTAVEFINALKGIPGVAGPAGPPGNAFTYVYQQLNPANVWNIIHNLNKYPIPLVFDSAGTQVIFPEIRYPDSNTLTLEFAFAFSGKALLN